MFNGSAISVKMLDGGIAELNFDLEGESVNKFNSLTVKELGEALESFVEKRDIHAIEEYLTSRLEALQTELEGKEELSLDTLTDTIKDCTKQRRAHLQAPSTGLERRRLQLPT